MFLLCLLIACLMSLARGTTAPNANGFVAQLIHITSPLSPFYNPNATRNDFTASKFALVPPSSHDFVMRFSLGLPSIEVFGIPDTASDLFWVQCGPQNYQNASLSLFLLYDPIESYTHSNLPCYSPECQFFPNGHCSLDGLRHCIYEVYYPDNSYSMGVIGIETSFSYQTRNTTNTTVDQQLLFGCGTHNYDSGGQVPRGVIGLRRDSNISLIGQLSNPSFSYCHNVAQFGGYIKFGSEAVLGLGDTPTPLIPNPYGNYHLRLEGIRVDGQDVAFTTDYFSMDVDGPAEMGFIMDTGTTYTLLYTEAYDQLLDAVKNVVPLVERHAYRDPIWELCYDDISGAPEIELVFTSMSLPLSDENTWVDGHEGLHCLAMQQTQNRLSVLGMYQQRSLNVGFDLGNSQVWFMYQDDCPE